MGDDESENRNPTKQVFHSFERFSAQRRDNQSFAAADDDGVNHHQQAIAPWLRSVIIVANRQCGKVIVKIRAKMIEFEIDRSRSSHAIRLGSIELLSWMERMAFCDQRVKGGFPSEMTTLIEITSFGHECLNSVWSFDGKTPNNTNFDRCQQM